MAYLQVLSLPSFVVCRIFLSFLITYNFIISHKIGRTDLPHPFPGPQFKNFQVCLTYFPKCPSFSTTQSFTPNVAFTNFLLKFKSNMLVKKKCFFLLNAAFAMANLNFTYTCCIVYYHAIQIVETFHILVQHVTGTLKPNANSNTTGKLRL